MILNNAQLVTFWPSEPVVEGALVAVEGKTIVDFGRVGKLIDRYDDRDIVDAGGRWVLPGMVNAHTRLFRSLAAGMPVAPSRPKTAREMREQIWWRFEAALDEDAIYWSAMVGLLDALRAGVTTVCVFHASPSHVEESLQIIERAFSEVGVRGSLAYAITPRARTAVAVRENLRHLERCRQLGSEMMEGLVGLELSSDLDENDLKQSIDAAASAGARFHVVMGESREDFEATRSRWGDTPIARLAKHGGWRRGIIAVHGEALAGEDETSLQDENAWLVHCPEANVVDGARSPDLMRAASSGLKLGLGTDGLGASIASEFCIAALRQRVRGHDFLDAVRLAQRAAFSGNADLAARLFGRELGRIRPGARADLVVLHHRPATSLEERNIAEQLYWSASRAPVRTVIVNGRILYHNGEFPTLDEERVRARAREAAQAVWERI